MPKVVPAQVGVDDATEVGEGISAVPKSNTARPPHRPNNHPDSGEVAHRQARGHHRRPAAVTPGRASLLVLACWSSWTVTSMFINIAITAKVEATLVISTGRRALAVPSGGRSCSVRCHNREEVRRCTDCAQPQCLSTRGVV